MAHDRSRLPRAEREQQMLDTAHQLFAQRGFAAVTMDEVANAVGVTKPLLYAYFGNKERLYITCMERAGDAMLAAVGNAVEQAGSPGDAMRDGLHAFFAFVDRDRDMWRVLFDETLPAQGEVAARADAYRKRLLRIIADSQLQLLPPELRLRAATSTDALATALLGASEALARWWLRTDAMSASEAADLLAQTVEPGLRALGQRERH